MKVKESLIPNMLKAGHERFAAAHHMKTNRAMRAGFYAGAAFALAAMDAKPSTVEAVSALAAEALGRQV